MCSTCSGPSPIRSACRAALLVLAAPVLFRPIAAQQADDALVGELARILAAADARAFDPALFRDALRHPDLGLRRQAALAAGRIGDTAAVNGLIEALGDSSQEVRSVPSGNQGPPQTEAATALAKIGGEAGGRALEDLLEPGPTPGVATSPVQSAALLEAWRLGARAPVPALIGYTQDPDAVARWHALYSLARLRVTRGVGVLLDALRDSQPTVRAVAARGVSRALADSATLDPKMVVSRIRPLLTDGDPGIRINALRALATFKDGAFADLAAPLAADADVNVAVQAETTLGVLGGPRAVEALRAGLASAVFALRRQAVIALASADGRLAVATRFVSRVPRADDYLVRRRAAERLPDAAAAWGPAAPIATARTFEDYREVARRYVLPALRGRPAPRVTIETDDRGRLVIELLPLEAPLTVAAFLSLVDRRYFDGSRWHRVVPNFVVQDGDPRGDGWGGPGFVLRDEVNPNRYETGTVGMALAGPDTGGSQFFITHSPQPHLDGTYPVFGRVRSGLDVLAAVAQGDRIRSVRR